MAQDITIAVQEAHQALDDTAQGHNKARSFHRREAQRARQAQAKLEAVCEELGIALEYQPKRGDN